MARIKVVLKTSTSAPSALSAFYEGVEGAQEQLNVPIDVVRPGDGLGDTEGCAICFVVLMNVRSAVQREREIVQEALFLAESIDAISLLIVAAPLSPFEANQATTDVLGRDVPDSVAVDGVLDMPQFAGSVRVHLVDVLGRLVPQTGMVESTQEQALEYARRDEAGSAPRLAYVRRLS
ncbi:hypothetical protein [Phycicoccus jejuensis]|uniref:hypothetical protein n=1 Tax=Phycicoccus jejuensis TaxID=367299 RepID=UPI0012FBA4AE|nr:hypothetical protein [Phycicoccus jejuensis]